MSRARRGVPVDRAQAGMADRGGEAQETRLPIAPPPEVRSRFALAAARLADAWLRSGHVRVSAQDFRTVRGFLQRDGWPLEELPARRVRRRCPRVRSAARTCAAARPPAPRPPGLTA